MPGRHHMLRRFGPSAYAAIFVLGIPALLALGAGRAMAGPMGPPAFVGYLNLCLGGALFLSALVAFIANTGKLPVNIDPPDVVVRSGPYALMPDPIYVGFVLAVFGATSLYGAPFPLLILTPVLALGATALVFGFENFARPSDKSHSAWLDLPASSDQPAATRDRLITLAHVLAAGYAVVLVATVFSPLDWLSHILAGVLLLVAAAVLLLLWPPTPKIELRTFIVTHHTSLALVAILTAGSPVGVLLPSMAILVLLGGFCLLIGRHASQPVPLRLALAVVALTAATFLAVVWTFDLSAGPLSAVGGALLAPAAVRYGHRWATRASQTLADSWSAVQIGPFRVINYALYSGIAAFIGVLVFQALVHDRSGVGTVFLAVCVLLGAGMLGRVLEHSGRLSRPFGYFGALVGSVVGLLVLSNVLDKSLIELGAALALAAVWIQAIGRLRCLVQGCCHGRPVSSIWPTGISYGHPNTRVVSITELASTQIYPTQLYSIYANVSLGIVLVRLAVNGFDAGLIAGIYLIGAGAARFVEEAYRGEPQTKIVGGLKVYQIFAIAQFALGVGVAFMPGPPLSLHQLTAANWIAAVLVGLLYAAAMGVDNPGSSRTFSQLTPRE
jgi:prolipoprotein diacylglyceryltransferase/protein-S-isoprenylcysteine O-methyltransferase Ste14